MGFARKDILGNSKTKTYHCFVRCVRRAFLYGFDKHTGKSYNHRRRWLINRIKYLKKIFLVEIFAYSIMENHFHIVLKIMSEIMDQLSDVEVLQRWNLLYPKKIDSEGKVLELTESELKILLTDVERIKELRERLCSISWFMKSLNEYIARRSNREDKCKGKFFESRFKCQALIGEAAIVSCMAYVDLNPIRAKKIEKLEESDFTSIKERLESYNAEQRINLLKKENNLSVKQKKEKIKEEKKIKNSKWLAPVKCSFEKQNFISNIDLPTYIKLVEWTGRKIMKNKRGYIPNEVDSYFSRISIKNDKWLRMVKTYGSNFYRVVGTLENILEQASLAGKSWFWGIKEAKLLNG